jgi:hypothetical protein
MCVKETSGRFISHDHSRKRGDRHLEDIPHKSSNDALTARNALRGDATLVKSCMQTAVIRYDSHEKPLVSVDIDNTVYTIRWDLQQG